jgi:hypothetical protein
MSYRFVDSFRAGSGWNAGLKTLYGIYVVNIFGSFTVMGVKLGPVIRKKRSI